MLPNFIVIGAGKSGTTTLYEWLKAHPEVFMSKVKETNFFALEGNKINKTCNKEDDPDQLRHYPWSVTDRASYENLFSQAQKGQAKGEVSPMYLYSDRAPKAIKEANPRVKLIAILRQPVERLHSRFSHLVRESREPAKDYSEVFDQNSIWWRRDDLVREGLYGTYIKRYFELFSPEQIRIYLYEDLKNRPHELIKDLYKFIGVDQHFSPDLDMQFNPSGRVKNGAIDKLIGQNSMIKSTLNSVAPVLLNKIRDSHQIRKWLLNWRKKNLEKIPLSNRLKRKMIDRIYRNEILTLETLIQRDLSHWMH